jgi:hypothetical protein
MAVVIRTVMSDFWDFAGGKISWIFLNLNQTRHATRFGQDVIKEGDSKHEFRGH